MEEKLVDIVKSLEKEVEILNNRIDERDKLLILLSKEVALLKLEIKKLNEDTTLD